MCSLRPSHCRQGTNAVIQPRQGHAKGQTVSRKDERDSTGAPSKQIYWICCAWYNEKLQVWEYRLKDGPPPDGKTVVERIDERKLSIVV